jgi:Flp pilus assembly protein TadG
MTMKRKISNEQGSAVLEFALSVILLTFLFTGTFQYGYSFYIYNNLSTSIRSAARFGSIQPYPSAGFTNLVKNVAVYGKVQPAVDDKPVAPGLQASNISVNVVMGKNGAPEYVRVFVIAYSLNSVFGVWNLNDKPAATFTYTGHYQP